jgi:hypothetical protein
VGWTETLLPLLLAGAGAALLWGALHLAFRDAHKAALVATALVLLFFSYGYVKDGLTRALPVDYPERFVRHRYLIAAWAVLGSGALLWGWRSRRDASKATPVLNVVAAFLVLAPLLTAAMASAGEPATPPGDDIARTVPPGAEAGLPNIYYVMLDGYAHDSTLRERFGYDNGPFLANLTAKGFYVVPESRSNYPTTTLSLASTLNMRYLDDLPRLRDESSTDYFLPFQLIDGNRVVDVALANGYRYVHFDSSWGPTDQDPRAWATVNCEGVSAFHQVLVRSTMMSIVANALHVFEQDKRARVECQFDALADVPQRRAPGDAPLFVFAHLLVPHGPFVFGADGELVEAEGSPEGDFEAVPAESEASERAKYAAQLRYTNRRIEETVASILERETIPPIILLASDHGSAFAWDTSEDFMRERLRNFEAVLLPGHEDALYPTMTPVNAFRVIFREALGAPLDPLEDRSYFQPEGTRRFYKLVDVTDVVDYD